MIQLRSLRVDAALDASQYATGAKQVVSANDQMARSFAASDAAMTRLPAGMARLSREFIPGYREADKFLGVLDRVNRAMGEGMDTTRAVTMLEQLERQFGRVIERSEVARLNLTSVSKALDVSQAQQFFNRQTGVSSAPVKSAAESAEVLYAAEAAQMERLTTAAKLLKLELDPLGAAQDRLNAELAEYHAMAAAGLITTTQLGDATSRANVKFAQEAENISRWHNNVRLGRHEVANLSYQLNDIAVMTASGQSPFMMLMQQGMQIGQLLGPRGLRGGVQALGQGIMQFLTSPVNLAVVGFAALVTGAVYAYQQIKNGGVSVEEMLKNHKTKLDELNSAYQAMGRVAGQMQTRDVAVLEFELRFDTSKMRERLEKSIQDILRDSSMTPNGTRGGGRSGVLVLPNRSEFSPFLGVLDQLRRDLESGTFDLDEFQKAILEVPGATDKARSGMFGLASEADRLQRSIDAASLSLDPLASKLSKLYSNPRKFLGDERDVADLYSFVPDNRSKRDQIEQAYSATLKTAAGNAQILREAEIVRGQALQSLNAEIEKTIALQNLEVQSIYAKTPAQKAAIAAEREYVNAMNTAQGADETAIRAAGARRLAYEQAAYAISEQTRQMRASTAIEIASITAKSPAQKAEIAAMRERNAALDAGTSLEEANIRATLASTVAYEQAAYAIAEANRQRMQAANDNIAQQRLEVALVGATAYERALSSANLRSYLDLQQQAAQNGLEFDTRQYELLKLKNAEAAQFIALQARARLQEDINVDRRKLGMSERDGEIFSKLRGAGIAEGTADWQALRQQFIDLDDAQKTFSFGARRGLEDIGNSARDAAGTVRQGFNDMYQAGEQVFSDMVRTGKASFDDLLDIGTRMLAKLSYQYLTSGISGMFGGGGSHPLYGGGGFDFGSIFGALFNAKGNAFSAGNVMAFAQGGAFSNSVVTRPTAFPLGIMGEKDPEAVMPLTRTTDGRLGVTAMMPAGGSYNSGPPQVSLKVEYYGQAQIQAEQRTDSNGDIVLMLREIVREEMPGEIKKTLSSSYGASPKMVQR